MLSAVTGSPWAPWPARALGVSRAQRVAACHAGWAAECRNRNESRYRNGLIDVERYIADGDRVMRAGTGQLGRMVIEMRRADRQLYKNLMRAPGR